ncbi:hypothetical protein AC1031_021032 [Aphanomyces cochlioides]|nr:hypothetical protein AC1031_021032 [Aphanomyces cochlioides]
MNAAFAQRLFNCPSLTENDISNYLLLAQKNAADAIRHSQRRDPAVGWRLFSSETDLDIYTGKDPYAPPSAATWCGVTQLESSIDEVADLFHADTSEQYHDYCRMSSKDILDGAMLYTLPQPKYGSHIVSIRWHALETPFLAKNRDFLPNMKHKSMAAEVGLLGLVRASHFCTGYVFVESDRPGVLDHVHIAQVDLVGNLPHFTVAIGMRKRFRQLVDFGRLLVERRLAKTPFLSVSEFMSKSDCYSCYACHRPFGLWRKKENCRKCGHVVCSHCFDLWDVPLYPKIVSLPICTTCIHQIKKIESKDALKQAACTPGTSYSSHSTPSNLHQKHMMSFQPSQLDVEDWCPEILDSLDPYELVSAMGSLPSSETTPAPIAMSL